jgi:hypothetical protein
MSYTSEKKNAGPIPFEQSDIPCSDLHGLSHEETLMIFSHRFKKAGEPWDQLIGWLDDRYVGYQGHGPQRRVLELDHFGLSALMREAKEWMHPYAADLA